MTLSSDQAAASLKEIEKTAHTSALAYRYGRAAPHLMLWGIVWVIGYLVSGLVPRYAGPVWDGLLIIAVAAAMLIGKAQQRAAGREGADKVQGWRFLAAFVFFYGFLIALYTVLGPFSPERQAALVPLIIACVYSIFGLWIGWRFVILGLTLGALTLGGYFYLHQYFLLWMAVVGGGSLMLAGLWLRRV